MKRLVAAAAAVFLLTACASFPPAAIAQDKDSQAAAQSIAGVVSADLDAAIAIAKANNDATGAACWQAIKDNLAAKPAQPAPAGAISAFEALRSRVRTLQAGVPEAVHVACAPLVVDANLVLLKLGAIAAGAR